MPPPIVKMAWGAAGLFLLLLTSIASAAGVSESEIVVERAITLPTGATVEGDPIAIYANDSSSWRSLTLSATRLRVSTYEFNRTVAYGTDGTTLLQGPPQLPRMSSRTDFEGATLRVVAGDGGYVGFYPETGVASLVAADDVRLAPSDDTSLGGTIPAVEQSDPHEMGDDGYDRRIVQPHASYAAPGELRYAGAADARIRGASFFVEDASGNRTWFWTGRETSHIGPAGVATMHSRWAVLEFDGEMVLDSGPASIQVAFAEGVVAWRGSAILTGAEGAIQTESGAYETSPAYTKLEGDLSGPFRPFDAGEKPAMRMSLSGDLRSTNMAATTSVPSPPAGASLPTIFALLLVGTALVGGGFAARAAIARRDDARRHSLDECVEFANLAAEQGRFQVALDWVRRARRLAPRSARLATDEAFYLQQTGDLESALASYDEASALAEDGEPDYLAASLQVSMDLDLDEAEARVVRALERTPALALEVEEEPGFDVLRGRARFDGALRTAFAQLERA